MIFHSLDHDNDGVISKEDLVKALEPFTSDKISALREANRIMRSDTRTLDYTSWFIKTAHSD